jgi:cell division protein FtsB
MLNVYAAIQIAVIQGQERMDKLAEHTERLNESISKLSLEVDRLEEVSRNKSEVGEDVAESSGDVNK